MSTTGSNLLGKLCVHVTKCMWLNVVQAEGTGWGAAICDLMRCQKVFCSDLMVMEAHSDFDLSYCDGGAGLDMGDEHWMVRLRGAVTACIDRFMSGGLEVGENTSPFGQLE